MKDKMQDKIKQMMLLAKVPVKAGSVSTFRSTEDSLSKVIRNSDEAAIFMAELNAVIKVSQAK